MAILPKILYNFNENDASTIRDYSETGNDGAGTSLSTQVSARVGRDMVFDGNNDKISLSATPLNGKTSAAIHLAVTFSSSTGTKDVLSQIGAFTCDYNYTTNVLTFNLVVASGTATVNTGTLSLSTFYDFTFVWASDVLTLYQDGVSVDTDDTKSGAIATIATALLIGKDANNAARMEINEFKLYDVSISTDNIDAFIAEQNGVRCNSIVLHAFNVGDIIGANINLGSEQYAIVTAVDSTTAYRIQPLTDGISTSKNFTRCGHLWDTARQWMLIVDDTPHVAFYDAISLSSEVLSAAKITHALSRDGLIKSSVTATTTYTATNKNQIIYTDSSGGAFTITLEASPLTNRVLEIIDKTGDSGTNNVTINGNGNNIVGNTTALMADAYTGFRLIFNGTQWNLN